MPAKQRKPDRRIRRTRRQLHSALTHLLQTMPYDAITVIDIVNTADISRATFYLHYKDKHELLMGSLELLLEDTSQAIQALPRADDVMLYLRGVARTLFLNIKSQHDIYRALHHNNLLGASMQQFVDAFNTLIANHVTLAPVSDDDDALPITLEMLTHQIAGALYGLMIWWLETKMHLSPTRLADLFCDVTIATLQPRLKLLPDPPTN